MFLEIRMKALKWQKKMRHRALRPVHYLLAIHEYPEVENANGYTAEALFAEIQSRYPSIKETRLFNTDTAKLIEDRCGPNTSALQMISRINYDALDYSTRDLVQNWRANVANLRR